MTTVSCDVFAWIAAAASRTELRLTQPVFTFGKIAAGIAAGEAGVAALDVFSEWKSIYIDFSGKLQRAQIDVEQI